MGRQQRYEKLFHEQPKATQEEYKTTADQANRIRDRDKVETLYRLPEFGMPGSDVQFLDESGNLLAAGYERMVYGDHGPYIEFCSYDINWTETGFCSQGREKRTFRYYDEMYNETNTIKLYCQLRDVKDQPNPPPGPGSTRNNRPDGYADYVVGRFYLSPCSKYLKIKFTNPDKHRTMFTRLLQERQRKRASDDNSEPTEESEDENSSSMPMINQPRCMQFLNQTRANKDNLIHLNKLVTEGIAHLIKISGNIDTVGNDELSHVCLGIAHIVLHIFAARDLVMKGKTFNQLVDTLNKHGIFSENQKKDYVTFIGEAQSTLNGNPNISFTKTQKMLVLETAYSLVSHVQDKVLPFICSDQS